MTDESKRPDREITVGPKAADVSGATGAAIQIAIDAVAFRGGGTVRVRPGEYELIDSIRLRPNVALVGERDKVTLRRKGPLLWSPLAVDADVGQTEITPEDASVFRPGMGVCIRDDRSGWAYGGLPLVVTGLRDGVLDVDDFMTTDRLAECSGTVFNHYPLILSCCCENVRIEGFTIDGRVDDPDGVMGEMRSSAIYLFRSPDATVREVTVTGNPGDGICFGKTSVRTVVEDCETGHNGYYGIHPGSHSAYSIVRRCHIHHNVSDGLYICWGIHHGEFTDNDIHDNGIGMLRSGISIGHKDADNLIARNTIRGNKKFGICFRRKTAANGAHRCLVRENVIEDNGSRPDEFADLKTRLESWETVGCGVNVQGVTKDLVFENNTIRETRQGDAATQRVGIWLSEGVSGVRMSGNTIEGHPEEAVRDTSGAADHQLQTA